MTSFASPHRIDRVVDALLDRQHPFWQDERQAAVYNEASSAALVLQSILLPIVGGVGLLIVGRPAIGIVTAMMLTMLAGQGLIMRVLTRRHVQLDPKAWRKGSSPFRQRASLLVAIFYIACFAWARFNTFNPSKVDKASLASLLGGVAFGLAAATAALYAYKRSIKKRHVQDAE